MYVSALPVLKGEPPREGTLRHHGAVLTTSVHARRHAQGWWRPVAGKGGLPWNK
jgi:hypothetical protein